MPNTIRLHRVLATSPEKVYRAFLEADALARFVPAWQGVGRDAGRGLDRLRDVVAQLQGVALPVTAWEADVLPLRVPRYRPDMLDELCAGGELVWVGAGALGRGSGRVALYFREDARCRQMWGVHTNNEKDPAYVAALARYVARDKQYHQDAKPENQKKKIMGEAAAA